MMKKQQQRIAEMLTKYKNTCAIKFVVKNAQLIRTLSNWILACSTIILLFPLIISMSTKLS